MREIGPALTRALAESPAWLPHPGFDPVAYEPKALPFTASQIRSGPSGRLHVLLIEDDSTIGDMYRVQLEYDGYAVTVASTADAGLSNLASTKPDIILLDLLLPDRSGLELLAQIKETFDSHPPVVILSNYGEPTMIERGLSLGAVEYLVKSRVTPESVSRSIPGWVEQNQSGEPPRYQ